LKSAIIIFVRNPVSGKVKTRLAKQLGDEVALSVYKKLLGHTHSVLSDIAADCFVFYADYINKNDLWENNLYHKRLQSGNDLGERMKNAFEFLFEKNYNKVVIIGSDCFELSRRIIEEALTKLETTQIVIGPANDGGYYLLGMSAFYPTAFNNKPWSSDTVFKDTIDDIILAGCSYYTLPTLSDVDTAEDLKKFPELLSLPSCTNL
jgi:rSAM/selenodomain-associated transferase 1